MCAFGGGVPISRRRREHVPGGQGGSYFVFLHDPLGYRAPGSISGAYLVLECEQEPTHVRGTVIGHEWDQLLSQLSLLWL